MVWISQHPHSVAARLVAVIAYASEAPPAEEERNIEKFGKLYKEYMREVPSLNFISGLLKCVR
jgi:protein-S-isoprenylcysteine O-methyltransferase Ste14